MYLFRFLSYPLQQREVFLHELNQSFFPTAKIFRNQNAVLSQFNYTATRWFYIVVYFKSVLEGRVDDELSVKFYSTCNTHNWCRVKFCYHECFCLSWMIIGDIVNWIGKNWISIVYRLLHLLLHLWKELVAKISWLTHAICHRMKCDYIVHAYIYSKSNLYLYLEEHNAKPSLYC